MISDDFKTVEEAIDGMNNEQGREAWAAFLRITLAYRRYLDGCSRVTEHANQLATHPSTYLHATAIRKALGGAYLGGRLL